MIVTGPNKAYALHQAIEEGVNHMITCSTLQLHPNAVVACDEVCVGIDIGIGIGIGTGIGIGIGSPLMHAYHPLTHY